MTTASTILNRLKTETNSLHRQIEENEYAAAIMNNSLTMDQYKEYLIKFHGFVKPVEERLSVFNRPSGTALNDASRNKTDWLERDLLALGLDELEIKGLPQCRELPNLSTRARVLGCLYVLEGSTLGGQMITRKLSQYLPIVPDHNGHYFNGYGTQTKERWQEFREELTGAADGPDAADQMIQAAQETFVLLNRWIGEEGWDDGRKQARQ